MSSPPPILQRSDGTTLEEWDTTTHTYRMWESGSLMVERPFTDAELAALTTAATDATAATTRATLQAAMATALATNATYLAKVTAGTAVTLDHVAQVPVLTRQMQAVVRLVGGAALLGTDGSGTAPQHVT